MWSYNSIKRGGEKRDANAPRPMHPQQCQFHDLLLPTPLLPFFALLVFDFNFLLFLFVYCVYSAYRQEKDVGSLELALEAVVSHLIGF